ncbi:hypothetical protein vseg_007193 [Gypsophila vaccaria]
MDEEESVKWGEIIAEDDDIGKLYRSYTYRGVEYKIFDTVYAFSVGSMETDIGKILMINETKTERKVKVLWFFRPRDICNFLGEYKPRWNELFLGCGSGKGLHTVIPLEAIIGKCNVICTLKDRRIMLPSNAATAKADYFFSHVFDVGTRKLSERLPDTIGSVTVERLLNRVRPKANVERPRAVVPASQMEDVEKSYPSDNHRQTTIGKLPDYQALKKRKISEADSICTLKPKREAVDDEVDDEAKVAFSGKPQRPATEQKWLRKLPWEEHILVAHEQRRLVTLINLDPSCTSSDVKEMITFAFNLTVDAKILPRRSFSSPIYGQALVIFNSMDEANFVISELNKKCLVDDEGRPIVAYRTKLIPPPKTSYFPGHIALDLYEKKKRTSKAKAVSTSHCAQQNTSECQLSMEWKLFHDRSHICCKTLHQEQQKEIAAYLDKLRSRQPSDLAKVSDINSNQAVEKLLENESALCSKDSQSGQPGDDPRAIEANPEHASVMLRDNV